MLNLLRLSAILIQAQPWPEEFPPLEETEPSLDFGVFAFYLFISAGISLLFGLWGKQKAEEHGVNPWVGFAAGWFLLYIGVRIIPILRRDRIFTEPAPLRPLPGRPRHVPHPPPLPAQPAPTPAFAADACQACGAPRREGRKACMSCGTPYPKS